MGGESKRHLRNKHVEGGHVDSLVVAALPSLA